MTQSAAGIAAITIACLSVLGSPAVSAAPAPAIEVPSDDRPAILDRIPTDETVLAVALSPGGLQAAVARGCTAVPGGEWFVRQAAAQFHEFTQSPPDEALMRAAFEHALDDAQDDARGEERGS